MRTVSFSLMFSSSSSLTLIASASHSDCLRSRERLADSRFDCFRLCLFTSLSSCGQNTSVRCIWCLCIRANLYMAALFGLALCILMRCCLPLICIHRPLHAGGAHLHNWFFRAELYRMVSSVVMTCCVFTSLSSFGQDTECICMQALTHALSLQSCRVYVAGRYAS